MSSLILLSFVDNLRFSYFLPYDVSQNAAAMCGVNIPVGDISMNISSTASLSAPTNPIGMEIRKIPNSKGINNKKKKNEDENDLLSTRLQDVRPSTLNLISCFISPACRCYLF